MLYWEYFMFILYRLSLLHSETRCLVTNTKKSSLGDLFSISLIEKCTLLLIISIAKSSSFSFSSEFNLCSHQRLCRKLLRFPPLQALEMTESVLSGTWLFEIREPALWFWENPGLDQCYAHLKYQYIWLLLFFFFF